MTSFTVTEATELLPFLLQRLSHEGRNKVKSLLTHGQISVNDRAITRHNHPLSPGQTVIVQWTPTTGDAPLRGLSILFEDEHLIVIDKPAGLLTVATDEEKHRTAYRLLMDHVQSGHPNLRVFVVHRLDRDTSGVMLFAKSEPVQQQLQNTWKDSVLCRTYAVLVEGRVVKPAGTITSWLKESSTLKMFSSRTPGEGLKSVTRYRVVQAGPDYSLLEVELETGRKNQIRVHMQDIGHSVAGDRKYGSSKDPLGRLGLHAQRLEFRHPITNAVMRFEAPLPARFRAATLGPTVDR